MFFANDENGIRVNIGEANRTSKYYCHVCNCPMIIKRGDKVAHHFAHQARRICDPYYHDNKSMWHREMQSLFPEETQERGVWNNDKSEIHVADVLITHRNRDMVFEFQNSPIAQKEFLNRTLYYIKQGMSVVWIFNYATIESPKRIFYRSKLQTNPDIRSFVWPGRDYVNLFDGWDMWRCLSELKCNKSDRLIIMLYVDTALGHQYELQHNGHSYFKWDYAYPYGREKLYILPEFNMVDGVMYGNEETDLKNFRARCLTEEEFYKKVSQINEKYLALVGNLSEYRK